MSQWRDLETIPTPDYSEASATLTAARKRAGEAKKPATDALTRWQAQQDKQDRSHVSSVPIARSEYRLKPSRDGQSFTVQTRTARVSESDSKKGAA